MFDGTMIALMLAASAAVWAFVDGANGLVIKQIARRLYNGRWAKQFQSKVSEDRFIDIAILCVVAVLTYAAIAVTHLFDGWQVLTESSGSNYKFLKDVEGLSFCAVFGIEYPDYLGFHALDLFLAGIPLIGGSRVIHALDKLARGWYAAKIALYKQPEPKPPVEPQPIEPEEPDFEVIQRTVT